MMCGINALNFAIQTLCWTTSGPDDPWYLIGCAVLYMSEDMSGHRASDFLMYHGNPHGHNPIAEMCKAPENTMKEEEEEARRVRWS